MHLKRPMKPHLYFHRGRWEVLRVPLKAHWSPVIDHLARERNSAAWNWSRGVGRGWVR